MKTLLIGLMVLTAFVASGINYDSTTANDGGFYTTNAANNIVTYSGKNTSVTIMPEDGIIISQVTITNSTRYAATSTAYKVEATIPLNDTQLTLLGVKNPYETLSLYVQSTAATAVVNFIWHD